MRTRKTILTVCVLLVFALIHVGHVFSQDDLSSEIKDPELEQEFKWLKAETYVITASKVMETIKKAPASITVITDRQIRQMGARNLVDVLSRVAPGLGAFYKYMGVSTISIRGAFGTLSNTVLLMINNHPINEIETGGSAWVYDSLIIDNIKRIEVIRGPGSALYGANAFHGVINVITKEAEDIDGFEVTARGGSYDTQQYNLLYGKTSGDLEVVFDFNYFKTHGFRGLIEEDGQTQIDQLWGAFGFPPASLAPGRMKGDREKYDAALTLKYKGFKFDGKYVDKEWDLPVGWVAALNHKSVTSPKDYYLTLSYETSIWEGLDLYGKVYRNVYEPPLDLQLFPPGFFRTPTVPVAMPNGQILRSSSKSSRTGIEIQATYRLGDFNTVIAGATYEDQKQYDFSNEGNYLPTLDPEVLIPLPSVLKWPDIFTQDTVKRNFKAVFVEDLWDLTPDLRLTLGARYDHYSDFGGHFSPRAGLTWEYVKGYDLKLLYGHAFRAPTFFELTPINSNSDLDPEKIDTYEISFGAEFTYNLNGRVTLYHREGKDLIIYSSGVPPFNLVNQGKFRDQGFELEMKYDFGRGTYLAGNYNYSNWKTESGTSKHLGKVMGNIRLSRYLNFYADCQHWAGISRIALGDTRDDPPSITLVNTTLIAKKFLKRYEGLELRGSVYNLLDKDWAMPAAPEIPNDLPMPGINYLLEIKYTF